MCLGHGTEPGTTEHPLSGRRRHTALLHTLRDDELFRLFVAGEDEAYSALYARYAARLLGYIHSIVGSTESAADDLFQETFLRLWRERDRCRRSDSLCLSNVGGWLFRVARNLSLNHLRSCSYLTTLPPVFDESMAVSVEEAHAALFGDAGEEEGLLRAINDVVETLPAALREVFVLREVNGLSYRETATIMGCSEEAARMRLSRARSAIRRALEHVMRGERS